MKLVLSLIVLSLCAVWVSSYGTDTELKGESDISTLVREEREALAGKRKKKSNQKKNKNETKKKMKKTNKLKKQNNGNTNSERKIDKKSRKKSNKKGRGKKRKNRKNGQGKKKKKNKKRKQKNSNKMKISKKSKNTKNQKNKPRKSKAKIMKQISQAKTKGEKKKEPKIGKASRQDDTCPSSDGVTNECLENAKDVITFEATYRNNFRKQFERYKSQNKTRGNKINKKLDFAEPAKHMADAVGGNMTKMAGNMSCIYGGDNQSHYEKEFQETYETLMNCSNFVAEYCDKLEIDDSTWSTMEQCNDEMDSTKTKTEVCRKIGANGADQCACWQDLKTNHVDVVKAIRPKCNTMQSIAKEMRDHKNTCVDKFKVCKKAQDYSILLIHHCQHFDVGEEWNPVTNETKVVAESKDEAAKAVAEGINRNFHHFISV